MSAPENPTAFPGMNLRDWFAGQALAGCMTAGNGRAWEEAAKKLGIDPDAALARGMYVMADAMLAERERLILLEIGAKLAAEQVAA